MRAKEIKGVIFYLDDNEKEIIKEAKEIIRKCKNRFLTAKMTDLKDKTEKMIVFMNFLENEYEFTEEDKFLVNE